ncbi:hypothetical protein L195_g033484 [Trifolium pratense]|uniref:Uncharacterized protein n=1 Tax=Trifolium pratense TaxID=57577 RepID=A0A2K3LG60_TRIPR|nr:hypothetical protein L195_g033484 [Trifolium pratense]
MVAWSKHTKGTICLNVDGSLLSTINTVGYSRLMRNNNDDFILGFYGVATVQRILFAELMELVDKDWDVVVEHTLREGNVCADVLVKMGALFGLPLVKITTPPSDLSMPFVADA